MQNVLGCRTDWGAVDCDAMEDPPPTPPLPATASISCEGFGMMEGKDYKKRAEVGEGAVKR